MKTTAPPQIHTVGRRQFLRGAAGTLLALPLLPSLLPRGAEAAEGAQPKRFIAMATSHGGIWNENMYPEAASLTRQMEYAGHTVRAGALQARTMGNQAVITPTLRAAESLLTPSRVARLNVLQGLDVPFYLAHHTGGHLGNFARNDGNGGDGQVVQAFPYATIDQVLAWHPSFYNDLNGVVKRSLVAGAGRMSYNYSNPNDQSGTIDAITPQNSSQAVFDELFMVNEDPNSQRTPLADRVLENYQRLRTSNRRLSAEDRRRLDDHIQRIHELQRKLAASSHCTDLTRPDRDSQQVQRESDFNINPAKMSDYWQLHNEVIATAMLCGASRLATMHCANTFSTFEGDWHQDIAHQAERDDGLAQDVIQSAHQQFFEGVFMDLVQRLDIEEAPGVNLLDNTLVMWTQECGNITHHSYSIPIITAGAAGGFFKTGTYADYRNLTKIKNGGDGVHETMNPGLIYNQWLANILQAMGLSPADYEREGIPGYGYLYIGQHGWYQSPDYYPTSVQQAMSEKLPFIT